MSHLPQRTEKDCLNCGTQVQGRYCHVCGQENVVPKESFWSLTTHFVYDILHFDGKFFYTLKYLLLRPGFVARQYVDGKRTSFLHPIRMYLFTSAVFFLAFFSLVGEDILKGAADANDDFKVNNDERMTIADRWQKRLDSHLIDSGYVAKIRLLRDTAKAINVDSMGLRDSVLSHVKFGNKSYTNLADYTADQDSLPAAKKDGWLKRRFITKGLVATRNIGKGREGFNTYLEAFLHKLPYFLFVSLPFFALLLKLLYVRRKNIYYSDHAVFTFYHYIFSFILLLVAISLSLVQELSHWRIVNYVIAGLGVWWAVYLLLEMKHFYGQGWGKTFAKFLLLNLLGFLLIIFLFVIFLLLVFLQS